jgi:hypothetical protein
VDSTATVTTRSPSQQRQIQHILCDVPPNAVIILGSLDTTATLHQCSLETRLRKNSRQTNSNALPNQDVTSAPTAGMQADIPKKNSDSSQIPNPVRIYQGDSWIADSWSLSLNSLCDHPSSCDHPSQLTRPQRYGILKQSDQLLNPSFEAGNAVPLPQRRFLVPQFRQHGYTNRILTGKLASQSPRVAVFRCTPETSTDQTACIQPTGEEVSGVCSDAQKPKRGMDDTICAELESGILDTVSDILGTVEDVDGDQRLTVVIAALNDGICHPDDRVQGCVRSSDLLNPAAAGAGDVIYLNDPLPEKQQIRAILAHELAHVCVYSEMLRFSRQGAETELNHQRPDCERPETGHQAMPSWLNEAIAHQIECLIDGDSANFRRRVDQFLAAPQLCPVFTNEQTMTPAARRGGARAAATLFLSLRNPDSGNAEPGADEQRLRELLNFRETPLQRIERRGGQSFSELFRRWSLSVYRAAGAVPAGNPKYAQRTRLQQFHTMRPEDIRPTEQAQTVQLRGTAIAFLRTAEKIEELEIVAPDAAELQITVLLPSE